MKTKLFLIALGLVQLVLGLRVAKRLLPTFQGERLQPVPTSDSAETQHLSVIVQYTRLAVLEECGGFK